MYESKDKMVSHPSHYNKNGMEDIDIIEAFTADLKGIEAVDTANAIKYILRWNSKNGLQDIEKAIWYLTHLKNHLEKEGKLKELARQALNDLSFDNGVHVALPEEIEAGVKKCSKCRHLHDPLTSSRCLKCDIWSSNFEPKDKNVKENTNE